MVGAQTLKDDMFNIKHGRHINVTQMTSLGKSFAVTPAVFKIGNYEFTLYAILYYYIAIQCFRGATYHTNNFHVACLDACKCGVMKHLSHPGLSLLYALHSIYLIGY